MVDGPFVLELDIAKKVLSGAYDDDTLFASIFMPDDWETDGDALGDPGVWKKCNPHIGITVKESFYRTMYRQALRDPEKMLEFKTKLLNIFVSAGTKVWISQNLARSLADPGFDIDNLSGRPPTMVSLDLSVSDDLSAVNYMYYSKVLKNSIRGLITTSQKRPWKNIPMQNYIDTGYPRGILRFVRGR